jgi:heat shock protein HslJ
LLIVIAVVVMSAGCSKKNEQSQPRTETSDVDARPGMIPVPDSLAPGPWRWIATVTPVERIAPPAPENYTLEFLADSTLSAQLDCNRGSGQYHVDGKSIRIGPLAATRMACPPGSLDSVFAQELDAARNWFMQGDTLMLDLLADSGTMRFVR